MTSEKILQTNRKRQQTVSRPVSYTHLDVYKRQRISEANFNLMLDKTQKEQAELKERVEQGRDVYKRQIMEDNCLWQKLW